MDNQRGEKVKKRAVTDTGKKVQVKREKPHRKEGEGNNTGDSS